VSREYQNGQIQKETYFDNHHNQTLVKYYRNGKLNREMKFDYKFDSTGNWTMKKSFLKQYYAQGKEFIPVYVETRKIDYYE
jgi:antitoxin component YwqK of YwqJK toxin-antitoxin module